MTNTLFLSLLEALLRHLMPLTIRGTSPQKSSPYRGIYAFRLKAIRKKNIVFTSCLNTGSAVIYRHMHRIWHTGKSYSAFLSKHTAEKLTKSLQKNACPPPYKEERPNLRARYSVSQREGLLCCRQEVTLAIFQPSPLIHASTAADSSSAPSWPL